MITWKGTLEGFQVFERLGGTWKGTIENLEGDN